MNHALRSAVCIPVVAVGLVSCGPAQEPPAALHSAFSQADPAPWAARSGTWSVTDGVYAQRDTAGTAAAVLPSRYDSVAVSTDLRLDPRTPPHGLAGVFLLGRGDLADASGYFFCLSADGAVRVLKDGRPLHEERGLPEPFGRHRLQLRIDVDTIHAQLDAYPPWIAKDRDARERSGHVALVTVNAAAAFDDVDVQVCGIPPTYTPRPGPTPTLPPLRERSFYCPAATTGAGASLLQFWTAGELEERIESFAQLPDLLRDARRMGSHTVYLVDWWQGHYNNKGDYEPSADLGGPEAFRAGIQAVHDEGGRVVLYIEPYILARDTRIGQEHGAEWAIVKPDGSFMDYYGRTNYYIMQPGGGTGWTEYLSELCGRLARDYKIDGVHLDSYGIQWGHADFHPARPEARDPEVFNRGVLQLIRAVRDTMRAHVPDAVVWTEGAEQEPVLDLIDGAQIESLEILQRKPWHGLRRYTIYTSSFDLREMKEILDAGHALALCDFWLRDVPSEKTLMKMREGVRRGGGRALHHDFWQMVNIATASGIAVPEGITDPRRIHERIEDGQWAAADGGRHPIPELAAAVDAYAPILEQLRGRPHPLPCDRLAEWLRESTPSDGPAGQP